MKFTDIPQLTRMPSYKITTSWMRIEHWILDMDVDYGIDLSPDYQRGHVWSEQQSSLYVEYVLKGGKSGMELHFNCSNFNSAGANPGKMELVDGKQRLKATRDFLAGKLKVFGLYIHEFEDKLHETTSPAFLIHVNDLPTKTEVMRWYIDMNAGGTVHAKAEISRVKAMILGEGQK